MLQAVSFPVAGRDVEGVLHLPESTAVGSVAVLHGYGGHPDQPHIIATCRALAESGVAALRFAYRDHQPPRMTLDSGLADAVAALRLLKAHPQVPHDLGVVGFSFGGAVAALAAGRDRSLRCAVLAAAPSALQYQKDERPEREIARTRGRVLLIWGTRDAVVPLINADRFTATLAQANVAHRLLTIEGADHDFSPAGPRVLMTKAVAGFVREAFL